MRFKTPLSNLLSTILAYLREEKIPEIEVIYLAFGNKLSRILFWSFVDKKGVGRNLGNWIFQIIRK